MSWWKSEAGQALVIVALGLVILLGLLGLGIDLGYLRYVKRQMQTANDAAAIAGALQISSCSGSSNCSSLRTAVQSALAENGISTDSITVQTGTCPPSTVTGLTLTINNPPTCMPLGSGAGQNPHSGDTDYVEVYVSQQQPTFFARVFGTASVPIVTRAEAGLGNSTNCVYALGGSGISLQGNATLQVSCGVVDYSDLSVKGSSTLSATSVGVAGDYSSQGSVSVSPPPYDISSSSTDPLSGLSEPFVPTCTGTTKSASFKNGSHTLNGGEYCGGISINGGTILFNPGIYSGGIKITGNPTITFNPGMYILTGGTFQLGQSGNATISGDGVTFYITDGGSVDFSGNSSVSLIAPTSGTYAGILFFQDSSDTQAATITGNSNWTYCNVRVIRPVEELFTDSNQNGVYDQGEPFVDSNGNGVWDGMVFVP